MAEVVHLIASDDEKTMPDMEDDIVVLSPTNTFTASTSTTTKKNNSGYEKILPKSSSRKEIKTIMRGTAQSSINRFFTVELPDSNKRKEPSDSIDIEESKRKKIRLDIDDEKSEAQKMDELSSGSQAILRNFIEKWKKIKVKNDSGDVKIEDKLWKYYHLAHTSFSHSRKFIGLVESSMAKLTGDNNYLLIRDILDSLKSFRNVVYKEKSDKNSEPSQGNDQEEIPLTEEQKKNEKKLKKVEKMMKKISEKIKDLEEAEVDLDDEDNSSYLMQERLKAQFIKMDEYYCRLANCSNSTGRPVEKKFKYSGSRHEEINLRISAWINKHREFPDYQDILNLVKKVTNESMLPLRPETVRVQAQEIFRDVGRMLKERRETDDMFSIYAYAEQDIPDPANADDNLSEKLKENAVVAEQKLMKVFQKFVDKEMEQKENNDKKADEKPQPTTEDDDTSNTCGSAAFNATDDNNEEMSEEDKDNSNDIKDNNDDDKDNSDDGKNGKEEKRRSCDSDSRFNLMNVQQEITFDDGVLMVGSDGIHPNGDEDHDIDDVVADDDDVVADEGDEDEIGGEEKEDDYDSDIVSLPDIENMDDHLDDLMTRKIDTEIESDVEEIREEEGDVTNLSDSDESIIEEHVESASLFDIEKPNIPNFKSVSPKGKLSLTKSKTQNCDVSKSLFDSKSSQENDSQNSISEDDIICEMPRGNLEVTSLVRIGKSHMRNKFSHSKLNGSMNNNSRHSEDIIEDLSDDEKLHITNGNGRESSPEIID